MRRLSLRSTILGVFVLGVFAAPTQAQESHIVDDADLRATVTAESSADDDRRAIRSLLEREEVRAIAARAGIDLERAHSGVATLSDAELARLGEKAQDVENELAVQDTITITTTTIIIALLILIVILIATT